MFFHEMNYDVWRWGSSSKAALKNQSPQLSGSIDDESSSSISVQSQAGNFWPVAKRGLS